ncbi:zinc finger MYM-type protein 1-like [Olea europaea var. sylvestris]|uniref:zinc finger MYM-type protein 1-like n=1 Tax=Olea europaea var. sylvestris TaxID=158386 RepID=UPI000C1D07C6|nr:zinc finger MYM-type protein 1-like [Olea europaea var. sylvestris]
MDQVLKSKVEVSLLLANVLHIEKIKKKLHTHVGLHDSAYNQARIKCEVLMNQEQHIQSLFYKQSEQARNAYVARLNASIDCVQVLLQQGHSFRGHDESEDSLNPLNACAIETINVIVKDVGNSLFSIIVDESCDVSMKEQMSIVLRYVDNSGHVNECFIGIEHVTSTTTLSLKATIDKVFSRYNLSMSRLRGQGYDGASNMQDVINIVGASSKRCDLLREKQLDFIVKALEKCEILSGRGLNQETTLQGSGDKRWSSHYNSLVSLLAMFSSVLDVLAMIVEDESCSCDQRSDATNLLESIQRFDFAFNLQLMRNVLRMSNELLKALQRKYQDIVNAI